MQASNSSFRLSDRSALFDNLKGCLIFLVVLGHCIESYITRSSTLYVGYAVIYSFHMPLFIFISGFFSKNLEKSRNTAFEKLLIPYLIWNSVYYLSHSMGSHEFYFSVVDPAVALWYLLSLFAMKILLKDIVRMRFCVMLFVILSIVIGALPEFDRQLSLSRTICLMPYFLLGYYCSWDNIVEIRKRKQIFIPVGVVVLAGLSLYWSRTFVSDSKLGAVKLLYMCDAYTRHDISFYEGSLFRLLYFIAAVALGVFFISVIPERGFKSITKWGQNSLLIYLAHIYLIKVGDKIISRLPVNFLEVALVVISLIIVILLSVKAFTKWYNYIMERINRFFFNTVKL